MHDDTLWRDEWIPVSQAAKEVGVRAGKISGLVKDRVLETRQNPIDKRQVLVQRSALYAVFRKDLVRGLISGKDGTVQAGYTG